MFGDDSLDLLLISSRRSVARNVEAIPMYVEELLLLLTCYVEGIERWWSAQGRSSPEV